MLYNPIRTGYAAEGIPSYGES